MKKLFWCAAMLVATLVAEAAERPITLFLIGDSTCATKDLGKGNPERGWGQMLQPFFDAGVAVENHAVNGRSTKSFRAEGRWDKVLESLRSGDYVFIEFGHNDAKINDSTRYSSPARYAENLRAYVREARSRGAVPVLLNSIVRRAWTNGCLTDTHGGYLVEARRVADEERVIFFDMEAATRSWVSSLGEEASRDYYMWVEPGVCPLHPDGRRDDTHLNVRGARAVAGMVADRIAGSIPQLAARLVRYDFVVARDGSGDFFTVRELLDALPDFARQEIRVLIRNGVYEEKIVVPTTKQHLHLIGESRDGVVLTWGDYASKRTATGAETGTSGSSSFYVCAPDFTAENLTFENSAGRVGQAVAVQCLGDRCVFRNCRFLGNQDTLYLYGAGNRDGKEYIPNARIYLCDCYVEGTTDFVFGSATALFERCRLHSKADSWVTAASTCKGQPYGLVFRDCEFTADEGVTKCYLGRPWRNHARTVLIDCRLDGHIRPEGWHNWNKPEAEKTTLYAEYASTGEGANAAARVKWAKRLSAKQIARNYSAESVLAGDDGWNPEKQ